MIATLTPVPFRFALCHALAPDSPTPCETASSLGRTGLATRLTPAAAATDASRSPGTVALRAPTAVPRTCPPAARTAAAPLATSPCTSTSTGLAECCALCSPGASRDAASRGRAVGCAGRSLVCRVARLIPVGRCGRGGAGLAEAPPAGTAMIAASASAAAPTMTGSRSRRMVIPWSVESGGSP